MPSRASRFYVLRLLLLCCLCLSGCTTVFNPATGRKESYFIGTQQEIGMGQQMDEEIKKRMAVSDDRLMNVRLERIGRRLAAVNDRTDVGYVFRVVKNDEFNAFAVPGGYIYVHSGLMNAANDDELAAVVGHEIGHVAARHSVKQMQAVYGYGIVSRLVLGLMDQPEAAKLTDMFFNMINLGYSRQDELQSDVLGIKYARLAGFDPNGMVTFFRKLQAEVQKRGAMQFELLSSHPDIGKRIAHAQDEIARQSR